MDEEEEEVVSQLGLFGLDISHSHNLMWSWTSPTASSLTLASSPHPKAVLTPCCGPVSHRCGSDESLATIVPKERTSTSRESQRSRGLSSRSQGNSRMVGMALAAIAEGGVPLSDILPLRV